MCFRVKELLEWDQLKYVTILAGEEWLENEIKGVTIIEAPDIVRFINGGEVLLTGLYAFKTCSLEEMARIIQELEKKNISALIFKRGRDVEMADEKIAMFSDYAKRSGVPMIEVPFEVYFKDVMREIMERLFNEEVRRLKYFKTTRDNFEALILSAGTQDDGLEKILHVLGKLIDNPVGVFDRNGVCTAATSKMTGWEMNAERKRYEPEMSSNYCYELQTIEIDGETRNQYVIELGKIFEGKSYLVISELGHKLDVMDSIAIESACAALQYELSKRYRMKELERKYQNDVFYDLLTGKHTSAEDAKKDALLLGLDFEETYRVSVIDMEYEEEKAPKHLQEKMKDVQMLQEAIAKEFEESYLLTDLDKVIVVRAEGEEKPQEKIRYAIQERILRVKETLAQRNQVFTLRVGVGKRTKGITSLRDSYREACDALTFLQIAEEVFGENETKMMMFSDLGILKLLMQLKTRESLLEYIPESLQKLYFSKKSQREDLMSTLRVYLDRNQNLMKAAQDLHIHYKTVAYRIEKIENLTGMDFNHAGEMLAVRIGLIVCKILDHFEEEQSCV